ncbi:MAG: exodeoxyribonuclease VII large subunit [Candidatus Aquilonibacter sp.]
MTELPLGTTVRSVSEFIAGLERWFVRQSAFQGAAISGEISGLKEVTGGHRAFVLKDSSAILNCIIWQSKLARIPELQNGAAVVAIGNVQLRREHSSYQMVVDAVHLTGVGELHARFNALKEKFRLEGLFDSKRKRVIPRFVHRAALISSEGSKASEDFLSTIAAQVPFVEVVPLWTRVQGLGADVEISKKFDEAERLALDVIVVTRGGGTYEDLFTFNEEAVVRAIARSRHPVITAIGHQTDHHLADDVADATYGTPSKAAEAIAAPWIATRERIANANRALRQAIENVIGRGGQRIALVQSRLDGAMRARFGNAERALAGVERRLAAQRPAAQLSKRAEALSSLRARLPAAWQQYAARKTSRLAVLDVKLGGLDPLSPLERGYALVFKEGRLVRATSDVRAGDAITARLGRGTLDARVEATHDEP